MTTNRAHSESNGFAEGAAALDETEWRAYVVEHNGPDWFRLSAAWTVVAVGFVDVVLAFRLGFLLAAANTANGFVNLVYDISAPLAAPFEGIISATSVGSSGSFEPSLVVAMLAYLAAAGLLLAVIRAVIATKEEATQVSAFARAGH
jgi:hypothetical protein